MCDTGRVSVSDRETVSIGDAAATLVWAFSYVEE
jgi:hypothetical protein